MAREPRSHARVETCEGPRLREGGGVFSPIAETCQRPVPALRALPSLNQPDLLLTVMHRRLLARVNHPLLRQDNLWHPGVKIPIREMPKLQPRHPSLPQRPACQHRNLSRIYKKRHD